MKLTSKCQVTVPQPVRSHLGIGAGSDVDFLIENGEVKLIAARNTAESRGDRLVRMLAEAGERARAAGHLHDLTTDEIMEMTRGPFDDVDPH